MTTRKGDGGDQTIGGIFEMDGVAPPRAVTDLASLEAAADFYGGDLSLWPATLRTEAKTLLTDGAPFAPQAAETLRRAARLDALLAQSAQSAPALDAGLAARLMRDAETVLADPATAVETSPRLARETSSAGGLRSLLDRVAAFARRSVGVTAELGLGAAGGLGVAAAAGLAVGLSAPVDLSSNPYLSEAKGDSFALELYAGEEEFELFSFAIGEDLGGGDESGG